MNILIANNTVIPATLYGGTERVIWWLGKELTRLGHKVTYLVKEGSACPFAEVLVYDEARPLNEQIPDYVDVVQLEFPPKEKPKKPYLFNHQGNYYEKEEFDMNTVFVSRNHAERNSSQTFVYNGIDPDDYGPVDFDRARKYLFFLGYAKRPEKNLKACAYIARKTGNVLAVVGGRPAWFRWRPWLDYKGFVGGEDKNTVLRNSKALLFPVLWHEPFGIAIIEAMYFGMPVFGTRYGSLPELVSPQSGFLSNSISELIEAVKDLSKYDRRRIHEYACERFTAKRMTQDYLKLYEKVLSGQTLNPRPPKNGGNYYWGQLLPIQE